MSDVYQLFRKNMEWCTDGGVLICGTGPSLDVLEDERLVTYLTECLGIFCVNTAHHFFRQITALFVGPRCHYARDAKPEHFAGKDIAYALGPEHIARMAKATFVPTELDTSHSSTISDDITKPLPFGPTTILDLALPAAMYCGVKRIYLLGAEYNDAVGGRFRADALYRQHVGRRPGEMLYGRRKWGVWSDYFKTHDVSVVNFSAMSALPFPVMDVYEFCGIDRKA